MSAVLDALIEGRRALLAAHPAPLLGAVAAYGAGASVIGLRLRACARTVGIALSWLRAAAIGLGAAFTSHVTIGAGAGELARLAWLRRSGGSERALAALALDRVADGLAIAGMLGLALASGVSGRRAWVLALLPIIVAAVGLLLLSRGNRLPPPKALARGLSAALPAAIGAWGADLARLYLVARAVGLKTSFAVMAPLALAGLVGGQAPTPGGLGAVEAAMMGVGTALALPAGPLLALVLVERAITLGLGTAVGAACAAFLVGLCRRTA